MNKLKFMMVFVVAVGICLPTLIPLMQKEFFHLHDFTHVARLSEMHQALMDGHFPVRWSKNLGYGFGLPQFNFYAPLAYYIAELFHLIGFSELTSIKLMVASNFIASFMALFYVTYRLWGVRAGLIGATAFIYIPYRAVDTYVRGAFGELTAITMLALVIMMITYWFFDRQWKWVGSLALTVGGLVLSHNLVALISLPFIGLLGILLIVLSPKNTFKISMFQFLVGLSLGLAISSFYAIPALAEKQYTMVDQLTQGFSDYHHHFLYLRQFFVGKWGYGGSISGLDDDISFVIGVVQVLLTLVAGFSLLIYFKRMKRHDIGLILFFGSGVLISMLLSSYKSEFVWDTLSSLMAFIQFPWRFLSIIIVFISMLSAASVWVVHKKKYGVQVSFTLGAVIALIALNYQYFRPSEYLTSTIDLYYTDVTRIQKEMSGIIPDFIPKNNLAGELIPADNRFEASNQDTKLVVDVDRTHEFALLVKPKTKDVIKINIFDFPGWQIYVDGVPVEHMKSEISGLMSVVVEPTEEEYVVISGLFEERGLRLITDIVSLIALMVACGLVVGPHTHYTKVYG